MIGEYNQYDGGPTPVGQYAIGQVIMQRITLTGFLVLDHAHRFEEIIGKLAGLLGDGRLKADETTLEGLENVPGALNRLFSGENRGKLVVTVS